MKKTKKLLVIPDVHGRTFWKTPVRKYLDHVDRVIFLGDYLDPYKDEAEEHYPDDVYQNFMEIIELKRQHMEKVVLLKGNHDEHYSSQTFKVISGGTRVDKIHWGKYYQTFNDNSHLFKLAHLEQVKDTPYLFTHAGLTAYWINKVNSKLWHMSDNKVSVTDPDIIDKINQLDNSFVGQGLLAVVGRSRTLFGGEKTGSVLWADIEEHPIPTAPTAYGLNQVYQVFGHTRIDPESGELCIFENIAMIDTQQCYMIDENSEKQIETLSEYEKDCIIAL